MAHYFDTVRGLIHRQVFAHTKGESSYFYENGGKTANRLFGGYHCYSPIPMLLLSEGRRHRLGLQRSVVSLHCRNETNKVFTEDNDWQLLESNRILNRLRVKGEIDEGGVDEVLYVQHWEERTASGIDWEIEKPRYYFADLRIRDGGNRGRQPTDNRLCLIFSC